MFSTEKQYQRNFSQCITTFEQPAPASDEELKQRIGTILFSQMLEFMFFFLILCALRVYFLPFFRRVLDVEPPPPLLQNVSVVVPGRRSKEQQRQLPGSGESCNCSLLGAFCCRRCCSYSEGGKFFIGLHRVRSEKTVVVESREVPESIG